MVQPPEDPATPPGVEASRAERRQRAEREPLDVRVKGDLPYLAFDVRNPVRRTRYLVVAPAYPDREGALCTCTDFARRGIGTCKHVESAWLWMAENPRARPAPSAGPGPVGWSEVDRRIQEAENGGERASRSKRVRAAGRVLFEAAPSRPRA